MVDNTKKQFCYLEWWDWFKVKNKGFDSELRENVKLGVLKSLNFWWWKELFRKKTIFLRDFFDILKEALDKYWFSIDIYLQREWNNFPIFENFYDRNKSLNTDQIDEKILKWLEYWNEKLFFNKKTWSWIVSFPTANSWKLVITMNVNKEFNEKENIRNLWFHKNYKSILEQVRTKVNFIASRYINPLTWLWNRELLNVLSEETKFSAIFIDLNRFKEINDTYWHQIWDQVLKEVWKAISVSVRSKDMAIHPSGDEFVVLIDWKWIKSAKNRIIKNIRLIKVDVWEWKIIWVEFAIWEYDNTELKLNLDNVLKLAEDNMFEQKDDSWKLYRIIQQIPPSDIAPFLRELLKTIPNSNFTLAQIIEIERILAWKFSGILSQIEKWDYIDGK